VDLMPSGLHRQYTSIQECKSVITTPSGGQQLLTTGFYNISGLAWSGRGKVDRVDVSVDGGRNWSTARLESPVLDKSLTRFNIDWGVGWQACDFAVSRHRQHRLCRNPPSRLLREKRGTRSIYHNNAIQSWQIDSNGEVRNVQVG